MKRAERQHLGVVIDEVRTWISAAAEVRHLAAHLPLTGTVILSVHNVELLAPLETVGASGDADEAALVARVAWFDGRKSLRPAQEAAARIGGLHNSYKASRHDARLFHLRDTLAARTAQERNSLARILGDLRTARERALRMLYEAAHMPITRSGVLTPAEQAAAETIAQVVQVHHNAAATLLDQACSLSGRCTSAHQSAAALHEFHAKAARTSLFTQAERAEARVSRQLSAEQGQVSGVIADLDAWHAAARQALFDSAHLALASGSALTSAEHSSLRALLALYAANISTARAFQPSACQAGTCGEFHQPLATLAAYHQAVISNDTWIAALGARLTAQALAERAQLDTALRELTEWAASARQTLESTTHMPISRSGVLSDAERSVLNTIVDQVDLHEPQARQLLDTASCLNGSCADLHPSAAYLDQFHRECLARGLSHEVSDTALRISVQFTDEHERVAQLLAQLETWQTRIPALRQTRVDADDFIRNQVAQLLKNSALVRIDGAALRLLPLHSSGGPTEILPELLTSLAVLRDAPLSEEDERFLTGTETTVQAVLAAARRGLKRRQRTCKSGDECEAAHALIPAIYAAAPDIEKRLDVLTVDLQNMPTHIEDLLDHSLGLMERLGANYAYPELLSARIIQQARGNLEKILNATGVAKKAADNVKAAAIAVRSTDVTDTLKGMDLDVLRKASPQENGRFRIAPLETHGIHNVCDVLDFQYGGVLAELPGLGAPSATAIIQAALRIQAAVRDETPVRIDVKHRTTRTETLLQCLRQWDSTRSFEPTEDEVALTKALKKLYKRTSSLTHILAVAERAPYGPPSSLERILTAALERATPPSTSISIWTDFLSRPADYFGMLTELGFITEDEKKMHGDLPDEIVEAVRAKELKQDFLKASLRTYQSFGARFALAQQKVVIGDEMGLGKTVEALAVFAHLRAAGHSHFLVVCPAAVVSNWIRETARHTELGTSRLHGPEWERNIAAKWWVRNGGVAVITYDLLAWAEDLLNQVEVGCAVFDEAHYIKNPAAKRSVAAADLIDSLKYSVLLTGTPLENSVQEFRNLIGYLRPDLAESAPEFLPAMFRKHVAPVYLRRNQEDVLTELPELVEIDEWTSMSKVDEQVYRKAVQDGQFMLMRRAAMLSEYSVKFQRLREIVAEAEANGRRVIVFSYFREVLSGLVRNLPGEVFGPLTGSSPAAERQVLVDQFSESDHGTVLAAQITAGGIGLNIQAASVVVICEPQLKPTTEDQAIARAHRMGQTNTVQVHRLLSENSVDERIREIIAHKRELFDEFARDSVIAKQAPDAVDVSDAELARIVVAAERKRLFGQAENTVD